MSFYPWYLTYYVILLCLASDDFKAVGNFETYFNVSPLDYLLANCNHPLLIHLYLLDGGHRGLHSFKATIQNLTSKTIL